MNESGENEDDPNEAHSRLVASIERFTGLMLDRLTQSPSGKLMDEKETRMLGSVVMRSYLIWMKAIASQDLDKALKEKLRKLGEAVPASIKTQE